MALIESPAGDLVAFLSASPSPYHAVREVSRRLSERGYFELREADAWNLEPGMRGIVVRGGSSLIAFEAGTHPPAESGFRIVTAHTDSPNLRLRPVQAARFEGLCVLSIEPYGSPLLHTWCDRDLALAGRVSTRGGQSCLVHLNRPVAVIPSLAIHLQRDINKEGLKLDPQSHLRPTISLDRTDIAELAWPARLIDALKAQLVEQGVDDEIGSWDLGLLDANPAGLVGPGADLLSGGRLDNLVSCHAAVTALTSSTRPTATTRVIVLYDHEEVGSRTAMGAQSTFLVSVLGRLARGLSPGAVDAEARATARSLMLSADMAHGAHPNFPDKHDPHHRPLIGKGTALKTNSNQAYATDSTASAVFEAMCHRAQLPLQHYSARNDIPCGSTVGPISAARTGIRTVDIGAPMLAMHGCRELMAVDDISPYAEAMQKWFEFEQVPDANQ